MTPQRLLLSGRLAQPVADQIDGRLRNITIRVRERPTSQDMTWADAFAGFTWCEAAPRGAFAWVHSMGAGVDAFVPHGSQIQVLTRTIGRMPERMGEFVLAVLLGRAHHLQDYAEAQAHRQWHPQDPRPLPERCVVLGTGLIATGIARALADHGVDVTGVNRSGRTATGFTRVVAWDEAHRALAGCDLLVAVLPKTSATEGIVDAGVLDRLTSAQLINVGRGCTLDLEALRLGLARGSVDFAHLDVFTTEPLPADSWLWAHPAVRLTPHVAGLTTVAEVTEAILGTVEELGNGRQPGLSVDWKRLT